MLFSPPGLFGFDGLPEYFPDLIFLQLNYRVPKCLAESTGCAVFGHKLPFCSHKGTKSVVKDKCKVHSYPPLKRPVITSHNKEI